MSASRSLALLVSLVLVAPACAFDTHGLVDSNGSGGSGSSGSTGGGACCEAIPEGWTLVHGKSVDPASPPGACADKSAATLYFSGPAGAPSCAPCQCGPLQGAICSTPEITCWYDTNDCSGPSDVHQASDIGACQQLSNVSCCIHGGGSCKLTADGVVVSPGTCATTGGDMVPSPAWDGAIRVCPVKPGAETCGAGKVCVPAAGADGGACVSRSGDDPCPAGFPHATSAYAMGIDDRTCTKCACELGCTGGYVAYDDNGCSDSNQVAVASSTCTPVPDIFDWGSASLSAQPTKATISACTQAKPQGHVDASGPVKVCCR